jgi:hypothetical protein
MCGGTTPNEILQRLSVAEMRRIFFAVIRDALKDTLCLGQLSYVCGESRGSMKLRALKNLTRLFSSAILGR